MYLLMVVDGIKTIKESVLQNEEVGEALLCNCLTVQQNTYNVFGKQVWIDGWSLPFFTVDAESVPSFD